MKGLLNYGRYDDSPKYVGCPRSQSDMTPCVARDGKLAILVHGECVGCHARCEELLVEAIKAFTENSSLQEKATMLKEIVLVISKMKPKDSP